MTEEQARNQALAVGGAMLITFVGLGHEFIGLTLFPGAEVYFGGLVGWYAAGLACIAAGLALLAATLGLIRLRLAVPLAIGVAIAGAGAIVLVAVLRGQFHLFALALVVAGLLIAWCHPKSLTE